MKKSINPLWGGRFEKEGTDLLKKINNSISFDYQLAFQDLKLNKIYAKGLLKAKIISQSEYEKITSAIKKINSELKEGKFKFSELFEDIHMNIEMALKKRIGNVAGKIHTGKSRNDQVVTDLKLWIRERLIILLNKIKTIQKTLINKAEKNLDVIMPGFTHLQNAQPVLFSHYLLSFFEMLERDKLRINQLYNNMNSCPLGSGALVGSNFFEIDRFFLAKELGFDKPTENSIDSVSDRDFVVEFISILSIMSIHFSKMAEDFIIWASNPFHFLKFPDALSTGSSIMPQKKNPDAAELVRSKTGRIFGSLFNVMVIQKGIPSGYSKDLQEDKEPVFDSYNTIEIILDVMNETIKKVLVNKKKMYEESFEGYTTATDLADWMVKNLDISFREAHNKTGRIVLLAEQKKKKLYELTLQQMQSIEPKINIKIFNVISPENSINEKKSYGGTSPGQVKNALKRAKKRI